MLKEVLSKRKKEEKHREKTSRMANEKNLCDSKSANSIRKQSRTGDQETKIDSSSDIGWDNLCDSVSANSLSHTRDKIKSTTRASKVQSVTITAGILVTACQRILEQFESHDKQSLATVCWGTSLVISKHLLKTWVVCSDDDCLRLITDIRSA